MASRFYAITSEEMDKFLTSMGFMLIKLPNTSELVYGKIVRFGGHRFSLRIYTAINPWGKSREKGSDAIRLRLFYMYNGEPWRVGRSLKCLRVKNWKSNLSAAIDKLSDPVNTPLCPKCNHPMVERERKSDGEKFWGCVSWIITKCPGRVVDEMPWERDDRINSQGN